MSDGEQDPDDDAGAALPLDRLRVLRLAHALGAGLGPSPDDTVVMVAGMVQQLREAGHDDHALVYALAEAAAALAEALLARRRRRGRPPSGSTLPDVDDDILAVFAKLAQVQDTCKKWSQGQLEGERLRAKGAW